MVSSETLAQFLGLLPTYHNPLALTFVLTTNHLHAYCAHIIATYNTYLEDLHTELILYMICL
jgi:hypothetical protein